MSDWYFTKYTQASTMARLREAEHDHLVDKFLKAQSHHDPLYAVTLAKIGGWLIASGSYLQTHFGNFKDSISHELNTSTHEEYARETYVQAQTR